MWLQTLLGPAIFRGHQSPQQHEDLAARRIQAAQRQRGSVPPAVQKSLSPYESQRQREALSASLRDVHARCDVLQPPMGGASASELLEKIAATPSLIQALDDLRPGGAAALLHALELPRWLESDGRVTLAALHAAAQI